MKKSFPLIVSCFLLCACETPMPFAPEILADVNESELVFVSPTPQAKDVQGKTPITFLWNKPIFKLQNPEVTQRALHKYIKITPEIEGSWQVLGTTGVLFEPKVEWQGATHYDFSFSADVVPETYEYWFETPHMKVTEINQEKLIHKNPLIISFSEEISIGEALKMFTTPGMKFDLKYHEREETNKKGQKETITDKKMVEFHPQTEWLHDTNYDIILPKGTSSLLGNMPTKEEQLMRFETLGALQIKKIEVPKNIYGGAYIEFTTPVTKEVFFDNLSIKEPNTDAGKKYLEKIRANHHSREKGLTRFYLSRPEGGWQAATHYEFLIDKNIEDIFGQKLNGEGGVIAFKAKFDNRISPVHFPREWKSYRHGVTPKFSVWHTGDVRDITLRINRIFPTPYIAKHDFDWKPDPLKRTIQEFDLNELAPDFIGEDGQIKSGIYEMELQYTNFENANHQPRLTTSFVITDFPVEINLQKTEQSLIKPLTFPGETISHEKEKIINLLNNTRNNGWTQYHSFKTDESEFSQFLNEDSFVVIQNDEKMGIGSTLFNDGISPYDSKVYYNPYFYQNASTSASTLITDRPLFKPGDRVFFKSFYRLFDFDGKNTVIQEIEEGQEVKGNVRIFGPRGQKLFNDQVIFSDGSTDGFWDLPEDGLLGQYRIEMDYFPYTPIEPAPKDDPYDDPAVENVNYNRSRNNHSVSSSFYVTEYRKPDFLLDASFDTEAAVWKDTVTATLSAEYAFGGGLDGKNVDYTVSLLGNKKAQWWWDRGEKRDKRIISGQTQLDSRGQLIVPINLDLADIEEDVNWNLLTFNATVHSSAMDASSTSISIPFSIADRKISLQGNRAFFQRSETEEVTISGTVTDILDQAVSGQKLIATIGRTKWVRNDRKGGDGGFVGEWRRDVEVIGTKNFLSKKGGQFTKAIVLPKMGGEYEITVSATDKKGRTTSQSNSFWIWSSIDSPYSVRGNNVNRILPLYRDNDKYLVGETAEILFPFKEWKITRAHATLERGEILEELDVDLEKQQISVPIKKWMSPNVFVSLLIEGVNEGGEPEIRWGAVELDVDDPENQLEISLTPEKDFYEPQDIVKLKVQTNAVGKGKSSEVTIAVVDQTLLALKARPALKLWRKFFGNVPLGVSTTHTLANFVSEKALEDIYKKVEEIKDMGSDSFGGGGGGGKGETFKARGEFRDTAVFLATVKTDEDGMAEVEFKLPDNLTTWNIWALGTTLDNSFGETETTIKTALPILISPIVPNFFRAGDKTQIGLLIRNNTKEKQEITVSLDLPEEFKVKKTEREITVTDEARVHFNVTIPYDKTEITVDGLEREFTMKIEADSGLQDGVKLTRKILPPIMQINAAEFLTVKEPTIVQMQTDKRSLQSVIKLNVFRSLLDRLTIFVGLAKSNNYGCIEQRFTYWTTRLLERDIQKQTGKLESKIPKQQLEKTIQDMTQIQQGGFRFWEKSHEPSPWLTAHILDFAPIWEKNGTPVPEDNISSAQNWLKGEIMGTCQPKTGRHCMGEATRQYAAYVLTREGELNADDFEFLSNYTGQTESKAWFLRSTYLLSNWDLPSMVKTKRTALKEEIKQLLRARDRYVFWTEGNTNRNFYSQDQRVTAIVWEYLMEKDELESYHPKIVRFLAEAENISGNTALITLRALKNFAIQNETPADTNITFSIVETDEDEFSFTGTLEAPQTEKQTLKKHIEIDEDFEIEFKSEDNNAYYSDIELEEIFAAKDLAPITKGFWIERDFYDINDTYFETPLEEMKSGQSYRVRVRVVTNANHRQVLVEDSILTGAEGVDFLLDNVDKTIQAKPEEEQKNYWRWWRPFVTHQEFYHDKVRFFVPQMEAGVHDFEYVVRARIPGLYEQMPPKVKEMYYPEVFATGEGAQIEIKK